MGAIFKIKSICTKFERKAHHKILSRLDKKYDVSSALRRY